MPRKEQQMIITDSVIWEGCKNILVVSKEIMEDLWEIALELLEEDMPDDVESTPPPKAGNDDLDGN